MIGGLNSPFGLRFNYTAAFLTAAIGTAVLLGWTLQVEVLKRVLPGLVAMNPATAICFLLAALSLALFPKKSPRALRPELQRVAWICAGLVTAVGAIRAIAFLGGPDLRLDRLLFTTQLGQGVIQPNAMAPNTALNFFLLGSALMLLHSRRRRGSPLIGIAALVAGFEALVAMLGYLYGIGAFYGLSSYIPMALPTAVGFLVLAVGIISCQGQRGFIATLFGPNIGGKMARRLLPAAILVPTVIGWMRVEAVHRGFFSDEFGVALYTVTNMLVFCTIVAATALALSRADAARARADRNLRRAHADLERMVAERTAELSQANAELEAARQLLEERVRERTANLAESQARLEAILLHTSAVVYLRDLEGRYQLVNRRFEELYNFAPGSVTGKKAWEIFPAAFAAASDADDRQVIETGESLVTERTLSNEQGVRTFMVTKFPLLDAAGKIYAVCGMKTDITDRARTEEALKRAKEEADQASRSKSEFLSRMSHELRTPMNAILGFAQLLELENLRADQQESVGHIIRGGRHLLELINEVLDIARIEAGRLSLSSEPVDLAEVLQESLDLVRTLAADRDLSITAPDVDGTFVLADRQRLKQVLINLLSNAIKYNCIGGSVVVRCEPSAGRTRILVADTGPGLSSEDIAQLFKPFERLNAGRGSIEGTGLGLAVARRLTEAMNGTIGVESRPDAGSTFWIELPLARSPLARTDLFEEKNHSSERPAETARRVLYIEDNLSNLRLIEQVLARRPAIELCTATTGADGLRAAQEHTPDLILLDLNLPDMHGFEVLQQLRGMERTERTPVIVISADAMTGQRERLLGAGAADYLTKPLDLRKFLEILDRTLSEIA